MKHNVFLIGMMASGKTTVGRHLANVLDLDFVDADQVIEQRAGADIAWIFDLEGEAGFREREENVIDELTRRDGVVLATGGGVVLREVNRARLRERGVVVYLDTPLKRLVARARNDRHRPLLSEGDPEETLRRLLEERGGLYAETADLAVRVTGGSPRSIADLIATQLESSERREQGREGREKRAMNQPDALTVTVDLADRSYPIRIGRGLLGRPGLLDGFLTGSRALVVTNDVVGERYLDRTLAGLPAHVRADVMQLPDGEAFKTLATFSDIIDRLVSGRHDRGTTIIALGGGVVGDVAGFAAAAYQRGVAYIQVPTTLLALVDSSVGGKTAVNHPGGKNLVGAFYQPRCVVADLDTLDTLPDRELRAGLAEVIKYGVIFDPGFLRLDRGPRGRAARPGQGSARSRGRPLLRDQGRGGPGGRTGIGRADDPELRPHVRARARSRDGLHVAVARRGRGHRHGDRRGPRRASRDAARGIGNAHPRRPGRGGPAGRSTARGRPGRRARGDGHGQEGGRRQDPPGAAPTDRRGRGHRPGADDGDRRRPRGRTLAPPRGLLPGGGYSPSPSCARTSACCSIAGTAA